ncbi:MAG: hypothetical protein KF799_00285 [Bdellovibrionales bacterium]|nr:hypothetical protein [Bdellovibrionales bacterium]
MTTNINIKTISKLTTMALFGLLTTMAFQNCSSAKSSEGGGDNGSQNASDYIKITSQPPDQTVNKGSNYTLTVVAHSVEGKTLSYQWRKDGVNITGGTAASVIIADAKMNYEGNYTVVISDGRLSVTSQPAYIDIVDTGSVGTITITKQPAALSVEAGDIVLLDVTATDSAGKTLTYQWYRNTVAIAGATSNVLLISPAAVADAGNYYVKVKNGTDELNSSVVLVEVSAPCAGTVYNGHCYVVIATTGNFAYANNRCIAEGGYLAKITTAAENTFVKNLSNGAVYIGATDTAIEGLFQWRDASVLSYTNWQAGKPDNANNSDCVEMLSSGQWADLRCDTNRRAICEIE